MKLSFISVLAAIVLASGWSYWLRRERQVEAASLRIANGQLRREAFLQHRAALASTSTAEPAMPAPPVANVEPPVADTPEADPATADYRFQGQATPVDTLQTMAWAMDRADVELMMKLITFDDAARPKIEAYRTSLPADAQTRWPTADILAATLLTNRGINHPYPRADLLARATIEPVGTDRVMLRLPGTPKDRETYQKVGESWKWVITEPMVDAYLDHLARQSRQ
ncbi:MAG TPA: hypothetical protein VGD81_21365 [Opitutaceae bacterium]